MFAVYAVSNAQLFTLELDNGLCAHRDVCIIDVTSATTADDVKYVQVQCSVDGQAQTLLLTRVANLPPPANTKHSGKSRKCLDHFQKQLARLKIPPRT